MTRLAAAGKLWKDEDFASMKMDPFCKEIKESLQAKQNEKESENSEIVAGEVGAWDDWTQWRFNLGSATNKKYKGLKFVDINENNRVMTAHKMIFQKKRGNNAYHVFATMDGFNDVLKDEDEANDAYWQPWEVNENLFNCMRLYYKEQADSHVKCYELGGDCQSDKEE
jgi:hypothetical protein